MKKNWFNLAILFAIAITPFFTACSDDDEMVIEETPNLVEYLQGDSDYSMLVEAVIKADLVSTLSGPGPFTLFAPNNTAFDIFLTQAGTGSIENTPADVLAAVLTNHVVGGEIMAADVTTSYISTASATSFDGAPLSIYFNTDSGVTINGISNVTETDIDVSNGVIHTVDAVIAQPTVVTFATADPNFSILVAALTRSDLSIDFISVLSGTGPFTVFAPTNTAFENLLNSNPAWNGLNDIPAEVLQNVLLYHVTDAGNVRAADITDDAAVPSLLSGETFSIDISGSQPVINAGQNSANIIATDVQGINGVIHVIDTVILPENL